MKLIFSKGSSLLIRLIVILTLAIVLMVADRYYQPFKTVHFYLDTFVSPLYIISNSPQQSVETLKTLAKNRFTIIQENQKLQQQILLQRNDMLLLEQLKHENDRLRKLLGSPLRGDEHKMAAQVLITDSNPYTYQVVINKGKQDGVYVGQPVIDEKGIIGQIFAIANSTSRAILICDYKHALPVQILRNDMSMVAVGNGCSNDLTLDFLPNNVDIQVGDKLVTSGLDGRFPEGYPVAVVTSVKTDVHSASLIVHARPTADFKRLRYLLLLWDEQHKPKLNKVESPSTPDETQPPAATEPSGEEHAQ